MRDSIVIERDIKAPIERVFDAFVTPEDLVRWHHAGDGWQTPYAEVDPVAGGQLKVAYADPEGKVVFELIATYIEVTRPTRIEYRLGLKEVVKEDDRIVTVDLSEIEGSTHLRVEFDIEHINSKDLQRKGWTEHFDNLATHLESQS